MGAQDVATAANMRRIAATTSGWASTASLRNKLLIGVWGKARASSAALGIKSQ